MENKQNQPSKADLKKKKSSKVMTILTFLFAIIGILLMLYPVIYDKLRQNDRIEAVTYYKKEISQLDEKKRTEMLKAAQQYNEALFKTQETGLYVKRPDYHSIGTVGNNATLGYLSIPVIGIDSMPFFHGTSPVVLDRALGHIETTSIPIGGKNTHAFITGHAGLENQVLFTNLNQLKLGDAFYINIVGETLKYVVDERKQVKPDQTEVLKIQPGRDIVTLQTCTPIDLNSHRLLITGHRVPSDPKAVAKEIANTGQHHFLTYEQMAYLAIFLFLLLLLIAYLISKYRKERKKRQEKQRIKELEAQLSKQNAKEGAGQNEEK